MESGPVIPHRKRVVHHCEPGIARALTFSCYERRSILGRDDFRVLLSQSIDAAVKTYDFDLVGFVYMPEHVHLLVMPRGANANVSALLKAIKRPFSYRVKQILIQEQNPLLETLTVRERPGTRIFRFWQEGTGFDQDLESGEAIRANVDYIHNNPIRRGLTDRADQWAWSSWHRYFAGSIPLGLPKVHGMPGINLV
jgi:putative transposase